MKKISEKGKVSFGDAIKDFFNGYFDFRGVSTRVGYWWAQLAIIIVYIILFIWMIASSTSISYDHSPNFFPIILFFIYTLALIVPSLALSVRRLRDTGIQSKTILAIYVIYAAFAYATAFSAYTNMFSNISAMISQLGYQSQVIPSSSSSPVLIFFTGLFSIFIAVSTVLPTGFFKTESDNVILKAIFKKK